MTLFQAVTKDIGEQRRCYFWMKGGITFTPFLSSPPSVSPPPYSGDRLTECVYFTPSFHCRPQSPQTLSQWRWLQLGQNQSHGERPQTIDKRTPLKFPIPCNTSLHSGQESRDMRCETISPSAEDTTSNVRNIYERSRLQFGQKLNEGEVELIKEERGSDPPRRAQTRWLRHLCFSLPLRDFENFSGLSVTQKSGGGVDSAPPSWPSVLLPSGQNFRRTQRAL